MPKMLPEAVFFPFLPMHEPLEQCFISWIMYVSENMYRPENVYSAKLAWPTQHKGAHSTPNRLLQYFQLPQHNARNVSRDIWSFSRYLKICIRLFHRTLRIP
jgi:hypothetical protein